MASFKWPPPASSGGGGGSGDVTAASNFGTDNRVIRSDGTTKGVQASAVTLDDSGNLSGVGTISSGAITTTGVTASRAVVSSAGQTLEASATTATEIGYVSGVTSAIQTQLNAKAAGAASSVDNTLPRFDGTGGKTLQTSGVVVNDTDDVSGVTSIDVDGTTEATSTTTGVIKAAGGMSAQKNVVSGGQIGSTITDKGNSGTSLTIDWNDGNVQFVDLTGDVGTLTLNNPISGFGYTLVLKQDGTGGHTVTWPASILWPGGTEPTLSTAANAIDVVTLVYNGLDTEYYAAANLDFS